MPWCDDCAKYWAPSSVNEDSTCPRCGAALDRPEHRHGGTVETGDAEAPREHHNGVDGGPTEDAPEDAGDNEGVPWHFKLMIVLLVIYLVYRFIEIGIKIFT